MHTIYTAHQDRAAVSKLRCIAVTIMSHVNPLAFLQTAIYNADNGAVSV